jgi:hypothetical protein
MENRRNILLQIELYFGLFKSECWLETFQKARWTNSDWSNEATVLDVGQIPVDRIEIKINSGWSDKSKYDS